MPLDYNLHISDKFSIVRTYLDLCSRGDWEGLVALLPENFVWEFVVFDGPNHCFSRDAMKKHFENIHGFKLGEYKVLQVIEGDDKIFIHANTSTRFMKMTTPDEPNHEVFYVLHVKGGNVVRMQIAADSKAVNEIVHEADAE